MHACWLALCLEGHGPPVGPSQTPQPPDVGHRGGAHRRGMHAWGWGACEGMPPSTKPLPHQLAPRRCMHACRLATCRRRTNDPRSGPSQTPQPHPISRVLVTQIVPTVGGSPPRGAKTHPEPHANERARAEWTHWRALGASVLKHGERGGAPMHAPRDHEKPFFCQILGVIAARCCHTPTLQILRSEGREQAQNALHT